MTSNASALPDRRDPRVYLAIERTFLAWTRTALALMGSRSSSPALSCESSRARARSARLTGPCSCGRPNPCGWAPRCSCSGSPYRCRSPKHHRVHIGKNRTERRRNMKVKVVVRVMSENVAEQLA